MTTLDPPPDPKRLRVGSDRPAILDTPGSDHYHAALDIAMDSQPLETIEDASQTQALPQQARPQWDLMSAQTPLMPSDSNWSDIPPAQPALLTQVDSTFPGTLIDTQLDVTQTQPSQYSDHYHDFITESEDSFFFTLDSGRSSRTSPWRLRSSSVSSFLIISGAWIFHLLHSFIRISYTQAKASKTCGASQEARSV